MRMSWKMACVPWRMVIQNISEYILAGLRSTWSWLLISFNHCNYSNTTVRLTDPPQRIPTLYPNTAHSALALTKRHGHCKWGLEVKVGIKCNYEKHIISDVANWTNIVKQKGYIGWKPSRTTLRVDPDQSRDSFCCTGCRCGEVFWTTSVIAVLLPRTGLSQ